MFGPGGTNPIASGELPFLRDAFAPETGTTQNNVPGEAINTITTWQTTIRYGDRWANFSQNLGFNLWVALPRLPRMWKSNSDSNKSTAMWIISIDLWIGLMAEDHLQDASVGRTEAAILSQQYRWLRDGDRFWFENENVQGEDQTGFFTAEEIAEIRQTKLSDMIRLNTGITDIQDNVFFLSTTGSDENETLNGGAGNDSVLALDGDDLLSGSPGDGLSNGNQGNDQVEGGIGKDFLYGGQGNDAMLGGDGNDPLSGDRCDDVLSGEAGADVLLFGGSSIAFGEFGIDIITDFTVGEDSISLSKSTFAGLTAGALSSFAIIGNATDSGAADALIVCDNASGALYYNSDGTRDSVRAVNLPPLPRV